MGEDRRWSATAAIQRLAVRCVVLVTAGLATGVLAGAEDVLAVLFWATVDLGVVVCEAVAFALAGVFSAVFVLVVSGALVAADFVGALLLAGTLVDVDACLALAGLPVLAAVVFVAVSGLVSVLFAAAAAAARVSGRATAASAGLSIGIADAAGVPAWFSLVAMRTG